MIIALCLSLTINLIVIYLLVGFIKRLIQYDTLFDIINEDLDTNIEYLDDMFNNHVSTNAPEIIDLDRNLKLMRERFISVATAISNVHKKKDNESADNV